MRPAPPLAALPGLLLAAVLALCPAACSPDPVAQVKSWPPAPGAPALGKTLQSYPWFKYLVWDYFTDEAKAVLVECTAEFDLDKLKLDCPEVERQDARPAYRAFCVLRFAVDGDTGSISLASARIRTYDAKGYFFESDLDATALARLEAGDRLLDCATLYATPIFQGM